MISKAFGDEMLSSFIQSYPGLIISGRNNEYFKSPQVTEFVRDTHDLIFDTITDFQVKYLDNMNKLHQEDAKTEHLEEIYIWMETPSYIRIKCSKHNKCVYALWFKF